MAEQSLGSGPGGGKGEMERSRLQLARRVVCALVLGTLGVPLGGAGVVIGLSEMGWRNSAQAGGIIIGASILLLYVVSFIAIPRLRRRVYHDRKVLEEEDLLREFNLHGQEMREVGSKILHDFARHYGIPPGVLRSGDRRSDLCLAPGLLFDWADTNFGAWFRSRYVAPDHMDQAVFVPETIDEIVRILCLGSGAKAEKG